MPEPRQPGICPTCGQSVGGRPKVRASEVFKWARAAAASINESGFKRGEEANG